MAVRASPTEEVCSCATGIAPPAPAQPISSDRAALANEATEDVYVDSTELSAASLKAPEPKGVSVSVGSSQRSLKGEDRCGSLATSINVPLPRSMCIKASKQG